MLLSCLGKISLVISIQFTAGRRLELKISCHICHWTYCTVPSLLSGPSREAKHRVHSPVCLRDPSSRLGFTLAEGLEWREYIYIWSPISRVCVLPLAHGRRLQVQKQVPKHKIIPNIHCDHPLQLDSLVLTRLQQSPKPAEQKSSPRNTFPCTSAPPTEHGVGLLLTAT